MLRFLRWSGALWSAFCFAAACSHAAGEAAAGEQAICDEAGVTYCTSMQNCSPVRFDIQYASYDACLTDYTTSCIRESHLPGTSRTPASFLACAKATEACDSGPSDPCKIKPGALVPPAVLEPAPSCLQDSQCASTNCTRVTGDACGYCMNRAPNGSPCAGSKSCESGICLGTLERGGNWSYKCVAAHKEGEACSPSDCEYPFECINGICAKPVIVQEGEACDGTTRLCGDGFTCGGSAICVKTRLVDLGQICGFDRQDGTFVYCRGGNDCAQGFDGTGVCTRPIAAGGDCSRSGVTCQTGSLCTRNKCREFVPNFCALDPDGGTAPNTASSAFQSPN
jgi:hypothetical protein